MGCLAASQAAPSFQLKWNYSEMPRVFDGSPAVGDLNQDGTLDVVTGVEDAEGTSWVIALSGDTGQVLWKYGPTRGLGSMLVDDINGDGMVEVVFVTSDKEDGELTVLNGLLGGLIWKQTGYKRTEWCNLPAVADINGDGRKEVVFAPRSDSGHNTTAFDAVSGDILWESPSSINYKAPVTITDMDGDSQLEIITYHIGPGWVIDGNGRLKWEMCFGGIADGNFIVTDVNNDGLKDLIVMGAYGVTCFYPNTMNMQMPKYVSGDEPVSNNVTMIWQYEGRRTYYNNLVAADFDGDGKLEIVHMESTGKGETPPRGWLLCRNAEDGTLVWNFTSLGGFKKLSPAVGDLDGDGLPDVLAGCDAPSGGFVYVIKGTDGTVLWNQTLPSRVRGIGNIADMDSDGKIDLIFHDASNVLCYETSTTCPKSYVAWPMQSHDPMNTGILPICEVPASGLLALAFLPFITLRNCISRRQDA